MDTHWREESSAFGTPPDRFDTGPGADRVATPRGGRSCRTPGGLLFCMFVPPTPPPHACFHTNAINSLLCVFPLFSGTLSGAGNTMSVRGGGLFLESRRSRSHVSEGAEYRQIHKMSCRFECAPHSRAGFPLRDLHTWPGEDFPRRFPPTVFCFSSRSFPPWVMSPSPSCPPHLTALSAFSRWV